MPQNYLSFCINKIIDIIKNISSYTYNKKAASFFTKLQDFSFFFLFSTFIYELILIKFCPFFVYELVAIVDFFISFHVSIYIIHICET